MVNAKPITLQELRAELDARAPYAKRVMEAFKAGDLAACEQAQREMREAFSATMRRTA